MVSKCCTVPCQRISFAWLYSGRKLIFFFNGQTKLGKECINSQMFCLISQTKSFSMSKCIDPWVDEVACSIKNLVLSLNRVFDVLIKICLYLSFSVTLSFLQVHTLLLPTAISSGFNASTHFHVQNPSTVTKPCNSRVTYCNIILQNGLESNVALFITHILTCLGKKIRLLEIALILTSDWIKSRRNHAMHGSYVTYCNRGLPWVGQTRKT